MTRKIDIKRYSKLKELNSFDERVEYLKFDGNVGEDTFGFDRYLNQQFYKTSEWKRLRNEIIVRDNGCDLGDPDHPISGRIIIHHMNPISKDDILGRSEYLMNPEYLVCVSHNTHNTIHYGADVKSDQLTERAPNDTCPWRQ